MNTKYGNELAKDDMNFRTVLEQFYAEWDGKR